MKTLRQRLMDALENVTNDVFVPTADLIAVVGKDMPSARSQIWDMLRKMHEKNQVVKTTIRVPTELKPRVRKNCKSRIPVESKPVTGWALPHKVTKPCPSSNDTGDNSPMPKDNEARLFTP